MEETGDSNAARVAAARTIKPGWVHIPLTEWKPTKSKPQLEHLMAEATRRLPTIKCKNWSSQKLVHWLSQNADDGTAVKYPRVPSTKAAAEAGEAGGGSGEPPPAAMPAFVAPVTKKRVATMEVDEKVVADEHAAAAAKRRKAECEAEAASDQLIESKLLALGKACEMLGGATADGGAGNEGGGMVELLKQRKATLEEEIKALLDAKCKSSVPSPTSAESFTAANGASLATTSSSSSSASSATAVGSSAEVPLAPAAPGNGEVSTGASGMAVLATMHATAV